MEEKELSTTIRVSSSLKDWLEKQGVKGETFDDVIRRLTNFPDNGKSNKSS